MAGGSAIAAARMFTKTGQASRVSVTKEITIGLVLGFAAGAMFKSWHWNERRKVEEYYKQLEASK